MENEERDRAALEERERKDQAKVEENRARQLRQGVISDEPKETKKAKEPKAAAE